jgi:hypothetical protein
MSMIVSANWFVRTVPQTMHRILAPFFSVI